MATKVTEDVSDVWVEYKKDQNNQELRNRLMERYLSLVRYNAERVWAKLPEGVDLNDLMSAGVFGLMDAIEAFDMDRGVKFETYCVPRIRGAMLDELRTMDWVPRLVRSKASKVEAARKIVEARVGRPPVELEIAEQMGLPIQEFERMKSDASAVNLVSLEKKWYETDSYKDVREVDVVEDEAHSHGWIYFNSLKSVACWRARVLRFSMSAAEENARVGRKWKICAVGIKRKPAWVKMTLWKAFH